MSIFSRTVDVVTAKINKLLDKAENPSEMLDLSYEKMLTKLQEVKASLAEVVTEQVQLGNKLKKVTDKISQHEAEAMAALKVNREDLAAQALGLKQTELTHQQQLQAGYQTITEKAEKLKLAEQQLVKQLESFRDMKDVSIATYAAAQAQVKVSESMSGINQTFGDVNHLMQNAQDKMEKMQARAEAIDKLTAEGVLTNSFDTRSSVTKELDAIKQQSAVADELAKMKADLNK